MALSALAGAAACKLDPILDLPPQEAPVHGLDPGRTRPSLSEVAVEDAPLLAELGRQLARLTHAELGGRRPGTPGAELTVDWIEQSMHDMGLSPAGVGGGWRQPVVVRVRIPISATMELPSQNDLEPADILVQGEDVVLWRLEGPDAWKAERPIVDVGYGVTAPEAEYDDYANLDVEGDIVLVRAGLPSELTASERSSTQYDELAYKFARARQAGAVACLVATGLLPGDQEWDALVDFHRRAKLDPNNNDAPGPFGPPISVGGLLSAEGEARLRTWLAARESLAVVDAAVQTSVRIAVDSSGETIVDSTIIGRIVGTRRPRETVVILAHWDAGATGPVLPGGGGLDNATGVAAMLAVARKSAEWAARGHEPSRSIAFVATASDSLGMMGTHTFLRSGPMSNSTIVALVTLDDLLVQGNEPPLGAVGLDDGMATELRRLRPELRSLPPAGAPHFPNRPALTSEGASPSVTLTRRPTFDTGDVVPAAASLAALIEDVHLVFDLAWRLADSTAEIDFEPENAKGQASAHRNGP